ncbi:unnamed protein product [Strongylus vulgaris]|uniref:Uncharacterized protein n=1 Tax=Strongylus vulgaris TaxID=40348 RepID=A0A3P7KR89_STRVU|nr:unnamed protein product [Strongylus vulgaris]
MYHSRLCDKLTYEQAITENLFEPIDRGAPSTLWHYSGSEQSSKESSVHGLVPGIAYNLYETPERVRAGSDETFSSKERYFRGDELTPGRTTLLMTPAREEQVFEAGQGDVYRRDYRSLPADLSVLANTADTLQLAADASLPELERFRESRNSYLEQARRMTRGTDEMEDRPSSVHLYEPIRKGNFSQLSDVSGR